MTPAAAVDPEAEPMELDPNAPEAEPAELEAEAAPPAPEPERHFLIIVPRRSVPALVAIGWEEIATTITGEAQLRKPHAAFQAIAGEILERPSLSADYFAHESRKDRARRKRHENKEKP